MAVAHFEFYIHIRGAPNYILWSRYCKRAAGEVGGGNNPPQTPPPPPPTIRALQFHYKLAKLLAKL